ncbi:bifunctional 2-dehydro-3-deoxygluconokinase/2-dehydro-3-deoxygalactonokinase [Haloarchaeobius sp. HME9146]|uniref:bifunctional 2-dehydro-3-deoxygluconokinase/2-dehydro-3- deoxygalactonokinase n=1 Tax=Haloarchaeobius sp. HME9146 TaxID=2978732 RepID=UPI0021BE99E9|nr:bifunctional 2-dehydro-3-deoxygluconokinase/2-dehydro-3-deoxygalactonokinase [Haloarchaeobius sp. HME9146]MCT9095538.1 sugar kinase [Haloarchaeobius sp. HME9146]
MSDDLVTFGETMLRLSPPGQERVEMAESLEVHAAGAESNTAIAAERLGAVTSWMSKLPDTPPGRRVASGVRKHDIDVDVVWADEGRVGTYYLEQAGKPRGTNVVYDRANSVISQAEAQEFNVDRIQNASAFFTTGITPALSSTSRETTANLLQAAKKAGTMTAFDVNYRAKLWSPDEARKTLTKLFQLIDVLIIGMKDAETVLDYDGQPAQLAHHLASEFDFRSVVVTRGANGALAWNDNVIHEQKAFETDTHDAIGSGDSFTGAFLARRLSGDSVPRALEYATATAALKRTIPGDVATVTKREVEAVINENTGAISR